ncbi:hypothetical protein AMC83_PC00159 (plasmid) [Rhizobium phaseoli]|uniref:Plasmid stabilization protein n=1 Tax=Rhizobium phaseoli TaxID=396 RepID=A0ABM6CH79_9HYPH|nr:hypothetical protein AMC88_PB00156 [Rhizobium phaseoli]MDH6648436.1 plasmid stabilization system protein ParE [Rhizobium esperanzae]ANL56231.1 hypothetical protein AMC86_PC00156 [Rhizobium phaseoli]ANL62218.1 hypothetical protein AMC85_PB00156 [Rhizobium phaseoli]ANL74825.1 hypothetical protein AMC83_PC00159 [Rhizobium phaseoli]
MLYQDYAGFLLENLIKSAFVPKSGALTPTELLRSAPVGFSSQTHCIALQTIGGEDKSDYTDKQKRKAEHIEESYEDRGVSEKEAERRAWATVNKESGGGNKSGSGRGKKDTHESSEKGGRAGGAASAARLTEERSASAKKAAATRKRNEHHSHH